MLERIRALKDEGLNIHAEAEKLLKKAEAEKRAMNKEENEQYKKMMTRSDEIKGEIDNIKKLAEQRKYFDELENTPEAEPVAQKAMAAEKREAPEKDTDIVEKEFRDALRGSFPSNPSKEFRTMQADYLTGGGYLIAPEKFSSKLLKAIDDRTVMRGISSVEQVKNATSLGIPTIASNPAVPVWTGELTSTTLTEITFGKRELAPHPLKKGVLVSEKLIRAANKSIDQIIRDRLTYVFKDTLDYGYMQGSGLLQPLGVFTANDDGISTDRDSTTTSSTIVADDLIDAKYELNAGYWRNAKWVMSQDMLGAIRKLQDGAGNYLWHRDFAGEDKLLGFPILISDNTPAYSAGNYVAVLGDFSYYQIADALNIRIKVLKEKYALTNQIAYIADLESDGMPILEEAFVRVQLHS